MNPKKRFFLGGGGALMPVLVSFLAIDIGAVIDSNTHLTTGNLVGFGIRYVILFIVGGIVAYLHEDETKPFKLFELGIAAPALITSLITAQGITSDANQTSSNPITFEGISIISSAHAETNHKSEPIILAEGFLNDVFQGVGGTVYRDMKKSTKKEKRPNPTPATKETSASKKPVKNSETSADISDKNIAITDKQKQLLKARAKVTKAAALAETARNKAETLQKAYQASLAQAKTAEAQVQTYENQVLLLEQSMQ